MQPNFPRKGHGQNQRRPSSRPGSSQYAMPVHRRDPARDPYRGHHRGTPNRMPPGPTSAQPLDSWNQNQHGMGSYPPPGPHHDPIPPTRVVPNPAPLRNEHADVISNVQQVPSLLESRRNLNQETTTSEPWKCRWDRDSRSTATPATNINQIPSLVGHRAAKQGIRPSSVIPDSSSQVKTPLSSVRTVNFATGKPTVKDGKSDPSSLKHKEGSQLARTSEVTQSNSGKSSEVQSGTDNTNDKLSNPSGQLSSSLDSRDHGEQRSRSWRGSDPPRSGSRDRSSRDGRDNRSNPSGRNSESSHCGNRKDRQQSSSKETQRESRSRRNSPTGSRDGRRDRRAESSEGTRNRSDRQSSSRDSREQRSRSSQSDRHPSNRDRRGSPPRRKRSLSPVDERLMKKRSRDAGSSKEASSSNKTGQRKKDERSKDKKTHRTPPTRKEGTPPINEKGDDLGDLRANWDQIEMDLEKERTADALLASLMSATGDKMESEKAEETGPRWIQSTRRESYYTNNPREVMTGSTLAGTEDLRDLLQKFQSEILDIYARAKAEQPEFKVTFRERRHRHHKGGHSDKDSSSESPSSDSGESEGEEKESGESTDAIYVMRQKEKNPSRLAPSLWYNDQGHLNDRPICRCSLKGRQSGIRHNIFPGELPFSPCDPLGNNLRQLHHYSIQISPSTNFVFRFPTVITYDQDEFFFEGLSLFSHVPLDDVPPCQVIRFSMQYTLTLVKSPAPENFSVEELDKFSDYLFTEILELYDFNYRCPTGQGCRRFHFMPRFVRLLPNNGKEILSMHQVMLYLVNIRKPVMTEEKLDAMLRLDQTKWSLFLNFMNNMIVTAPGKKPSSVRVDQVDRDFAVCTKEKKVFPVIVHAGVMPLQLSYTANPRYKKLYKSFLRMKHLFLNRSRVSEEEKSEFVRIQDEMAAIRRSTFVGNEVTAELDCSTMTMTGLRSDVCQHALILPVLVNYIRYHICLDKLNEKLGNIFTDKVLLKRAMTHPSYRLTYGMNSDHIRNSLYNCALRSPEFGEKNWQRSSENRKKGIIHLVKIMSRLGEEEEVSSNIHHYERLEFLGDAVVEFITSTALYHLFPNLEEGGLAMYRQALVENQHLTKVAMNLDLEHFMLYSHGADLCHNKDLDHALANCFEGLMGAVYLECGIDTARKIFCSSAFVEEDLQLIWASYPKHPLQQQHPDGDRHMIEDFPVLKRMTEFEEQTGMTFKHIRLLARAFTQRTVVYNDLTLGHNQRMEFLGDSVLQLVVSAYLFRHFPDHHEGHLSLLRSSLVNNITQSIIAKDLGLEDFMIEMSIPQASRRAASKKLFADLLEALIGAMYVDRGLDVVEAFCNVCFFPRLREFIIRQDWNDDKSKLQQVVLTLRREGAANPDVPHYRLLKQAGPTNSSVYTVAVFFKGRRIGEGTAHSIRSAEKKAAKDALNKGQYEQIKYQTKLMSSLYPREFKPPHPQRPDQRPRKLPLPKQYAHPPSEKRKDKQH